MKLIFYKYRLRKKNDEDHSFKSHSLLVMKLKISLKGFHNHHQYLKKILKIVKQKV